MAIPYFINLSRNRNLVSKRFQLAYCHPRLPQAEIGGITDKVLSKELKSLEANRLIQRTVYDTFPPTVEYAITAHGLSLEKVLEELHYWGLAHRKKIIGK